MKSLFVAFNLVVVLGLFAGADAVAADFYQGKTIKMIVGGAVGGGYDSQARLLAAHLGKHIPGHPTIVVQNMTAGAGVGALNYVFNVAEKDGTVIGQFDRDAMILPLLGEQLANFKLNEFNWLGTPASYSDNAFAILIRSALPYENFDQIRKAKTPLVFGNRGSIFPHLTREALGANLKVLEGYKGEEVNLAMERGEVDGQGTGYLNIARRTPQWLADKSIRIIVQFGHEKRLAALSDVPTGRELAQTPADLELVKFCELSLTLGYPFAAPPGVPADRIALLRKAFDAVTADPAYKAAIEKAKLEFSPSSGAALAADIAEATQASPAVIARYKKVAAPLGGAR